MLFYYFILYIFYMIYILNERYMNIEKDYNYIYFKMILFVSFI